MKIGCDACGRAEAQVLCCADEAALCRRCDAAVHSANKLASRHHRVGLLPSAGPSRNAVVDGSGSHPACDICQEKTGYFFCLEDRALLCRPCDVAVHAAGAHVSSHRRFLITGVRVGGVESHHVVPGTDGVADSGVSPGSSSGNASSSAPSSGSLMNMPDKVRPSPSSVRVAAAREDLAGQQWPWSEVLADDAVVTGMELCCSAGLSKPGSPSLTG